MCGAAGGEETSHDYGETVCEQYTLRTVVVVSRNRRMMWTRKLSSRANALTVAGDNKVWETV